jgi:hypothetical protein
MQEAQARAKQAYDEHRAAAAAVRVSDKYNGSMQWSLSFTREDGGPAEGKVFQSSWIKSTHFAQIALVVDSNLGPAIC